MQKKFMIAPKWKILHKNPKTNHIVKCQYHADKIYIYFACLTFIFEIEQIPELLNCRQYLTMKELIELRNS